MALPPDLLLVTMGSAVLVGVKVKTFNYTVICLSILWVVKGADHLVGHEWEPLTRWVPRHLAEPLREL